MRSSTLDASLVSAGKRGEPLERLVSKYCTMSALSIRGSDRDADVKDGMVPFGLILMYSGLKFSASTASCLLGMESIYVVGIGVLRPSLTEANLLDCVLARLVSLFVEG